MSSFKDIADVLNQFNVGVFPVKNNPGKYTISFQNAAGNRQFIDRQKITREDGTEYWAWKVGKEMQAQQPQAAQPVAQIQMAQ